VIATLGGPLLQGTIDSLNSGSIALSEIIIAIPEAYAERVAHIRAHNVIILKTVSKGQVPQRCEGFSVSQSDFVLQCDDDVVLEHTCIENLLLSIQRAGDKAACAAALYFLKTDYSVYKRSKLGIIGRLYYSLLNGKAGYREGVVTKAGTEIGVDANLHQGDNPLFPVEWIPGGLALHHKKNLVLESYYPHQGKAYSEDLYHSRELRNKGISLYVVLKAKAWIEDPRLMETQKTSHFFRNMRRDFITRKYYIEQDQKNILRSYFFYLFMSLSFFIKKVKR
jgi:GT2 family glycosyltransferase